MARASGERSGNWAAFAAGAVAMLIVALIWAAWSGREAGTGLIRAAAHVAAKPDLPVPRLPGAPQLPDPPRLPAAPSPTPR